MHKLEKIQNGDFGGFTYLAEIPLDTLPQFLSILKHIITNLSVRFFNISASLNRGVVKDYIDYDAMVILRGAPTGDGTRCGLSRLLEVFNMRHITMPIHLLGTFWLHGIEPEWGQFMSRALDRRDRVLVSANQRSVCGTTREKKTMDLLQIQPTPNLIDAFEVIDRENFTNLWRFLVRVHTIIPTTVACEQSFSFFKQTIHINMSDQTAKIFLMARLSHYNYDYNL